MLKHCIASRVLFSYVLYALFSFPVSCFSLLSCVSAFAVISLVLPISWFIPSSCVSVRMWSCFLFYVWCLFSRPVPLILFHISLFYSSLCFALVPSSIFCCSSPAREFSSVYCTHFFFLFIYSPYDFTLQFPVGELE